MTFTMQFSLKINNNFVPEDQLRKKKETLGRAISRSGIEGAIHITNNGLEIMGEKEHDYIDHLISYITNDIDNIFLGKPFSTNFPDQPIQLQITTNGNKILLSIGKTRTAIPRCDFLRELYRLCQRFFDLMLTLFPSGWDEFYTRKLAELPTRYPDILTTPPQ